MSESATLRQLPGPESTRLAGLVGAFEDLQVVLRCCERLIAELAAAQEVPEEEQDAGDRSVVLEALWTLALLSYARCFTAGEDGVALTRDDLTEAQPEGDVLGWHDLLLQLRDHHADPAENPRERFTVGVAQGEDGAASGVAVTSARQPAVDDLTVRQTGAVAYALSGLLDRRIQQAQAALAADLAERSPADLEQLDPLEVSDAAGPS